jgi:hypothetical protein
MPVRPLTTTEIEAIRRGKRLSSLERRALATIDNLQAQLAAAKYAPGSGNGETAFAGREKVLAVVAWDGFIEVYAEPWCDVKVVECWPWDDEDELRLPACYEGLYYPGKLRATALARLRQTPRLPEIVMAFREHDARMEMIELVREKIAALTNGTDEPEQRTNGE